MSMSSELNVARRKLAEALGDDMKRYLLILKSWFRQNIDRQEFDYDARKLIPNEYLPLHNEFLLCILAKCQTLGSSLATNRDPSQLKKQKVKVRKRTPSKIGFNQRFVPADPLKTAPQAVTKPPEEEGGVLFCSREMILPDSGMLHGRLLVAAWESGLDDVSDNAVSLLKVALENQLKNVITAALSRRNAYRAREKRIKCDSNGIKVPKVFLKGSKENPEQNSDTSAPSEAKRRLLSQDEFAPIPKGPVTMYDMLEGLQQYRTTIASHTIYSTTVEKILHRLWHPSHEELEQDEIFRQESVVKQEAELQTMIQTVDWNRPPP